MLLSNRARKVFAVYQQNVRVHRKRHPFNAAVSRAASKSHSNFVQKCVAIRKANLSSKQCVRRCSRYCSYILYTRKWSKWIVKLSRLVQTFHRSVLLWRSVRSLFLSFIYTFFTETHLLNCFNYFFRITAKFLISILTEENLEKVEQIVIIRLWLKCSMLSMGANEVC